MVSTRHLNTSAAGQTTPLKLIIPAIGVLVLSLLVLSGFGRIPPSGDFEGLIVAPARQDAATAVFGEATQLPLDSDNDGLPDEQDRCPADYGLEEHNGCPPDSDGDGTIDDLDACPLVHGRGEHNGCPPDRDGDGIPDHEDQCPDVPGVHDWAGCPPPTPTPVIPALPTTGACVIATRTWQNVNIRLEPEADSEVVGTLFYYEPLPALESRVNDADEEWFRVEAGWIFGSVTRRGGECDNLGGPTLIFADETGAQLAGIDLLVEEGDADGVHLGYYLVRDGVITPLVIEPEHEADVLFPVLSPDGRWLSYLLRTGPDQRTLKLMNTATQETRVLFESTAAQVVPQVRTTWSSDSQYLLFSVTDSASNRTDVYELAIETQSEPEQMLEDGFWAAYSPDDAYIVFARATGETTGQLYVLTVSSQSIRPLHLPQQHCSNAIFNSDSTGLVLNCWQGGIGQFYRYDASGLTAIPIAQTDPRYLNLMADGSLVFLDGPTVYLRSADGSTTVPVLTSQAGTLTYLQALGN